MYEVKARERASGLQRGERLMDWLEVPGRHFGERARQPRRVRAAHHGEVRHEEVELLRAAREDVEEHVGGLRARGTRGGQDDKARCHHEEEGGKDGEAARRAHPRSGLKSKLNITRSEGRIHSAGTGATARAAMLGPQGTCW